MFFGVAADAYVWHRVMTEGRFPVQLSLLAPVMAMIGLAVVLNPMTKADNLARFGVEQRPLKHYPLSSKILIALGLVGAVAQLIYFKT